MEPKFICATVTDGKLLDAGSTMFVLDACLRNKQRIAEHAKLENISRFLDKNKKNIPIAMKINMKWTVFSENFLRYSISGVKIKQRVNTKKPNEITDAIILLFTFSLIL